MVRCGHGVIAYTYPAWSFSGTRKNDDATPGPGPGNYVPGISFNTVGPGFGPPSRTTNAPSHGPASPRGAYNFKSGGPAWTMGGKRPGQDNGNPGPQDYRPMTTFTMPAHPAPSWGPAPRPRSESAPRELRIPDTVSRRAAKGPTFGMPRAPLHDEGVPGANTYQPFCNGCCKACDGYKGHSFGLRPPMFYGKVVGSTPGPAGYHTECSSIGAATQSCASGSSGSRRSKRT